MKDNSPMESKNLKKKKVCPKCGSHEVKQFIYGTLDETKIKWDNLIYGGCIITEDSPKWFCLSCGHEWGKHPQF